MEGRKATVTLDGEELNGRVEAVHGKGEKIDVRIDHPGSKKHGRVLTLDADDVDVEKPKSTPEDLPMGAKATEKFAKAVHDRITAIEKNASDLEADVNGLKARVSDLEEKLAAAIAASLAPPDPDGGQAASA